MNVVHLAEFYMRVDRSWVEHVRVIPS